MMWSPSICRWCRKRRWRCWPRRIGADPFRYLWRVLAGSGCRAYCRLSRNRVITADEGARRARYSSEENADEALKNLNVKKTGQ
ncbi:hypothetical protein KIF59_09030 [Enterobacter cloacae subsp. cloacae]|nr:hypothetical protein [Enterobacter cloacae subsp. cloacae]